MSGINYDAIADGYDKRYETAYRPDGIALTLLNLVHKVGARRVLEVGCGTGHWLQVLQDHACIVGLDLSFGMLHKAAGSKGKRLLVRGKASQLPFSYHTFDMVVCVNALHHFSDPSRFVTETRRLLTREGVFSVIGMNPHSGKDRWFIYDYFPGTRETDLERYPSPEDITEWMISAGFEKVSQQVAERIRDDKQDEEVLTLYQGFTSQLSLLPLEEYEEGMARIEKALGKAKAAGRNVVFTTDISLLMVNGWVKGELSKEERL